MPNPKEISQKKFEKALGFGYRMDDVDEYLDTVAAEMQSLLESKADLEKKLEVLADKLTEYREDEESLRTAILSAQKLGDNVIRESKTKAEIIMRDATIKADAMVSNARRQIEHENESLKKLQREVASFKNRLIALYRQHLELVTALPGDIEDETKTKESKSSDDTSPSSDNINEDVNKDYHAMSEGNERSLKNEDSNLSQSSFKNIEEPTASKDELKKTETTVTDATIEFGSEKASEQINNSEYEEQKNKYSQPPIKRFVVGEDDIPPMPSKNESEADTQSLKSVFDEDEIDNEELDLSFFNKANSQISSKHDKDLRFGESFKIKRDSSFPRFR